MCGRWLINGYPKVVLFDLGSAWKKLNQWRKELYELCNIGWPEGDTETNNALVFGNLVCWFISEVGRRGCGTVGGAEGVWYSYDAVEAVSQVDKLINRFPQARQTVQTYSDCLPNGSLVLVLAHGVIHEGHP